MDQKNNFADSVMKHHEKEISDIFEDLTKGSSIGNAIDNIFEESSNIDEVQTKLILLIQKYAKDFNDKNYKPDQKIEFDDEKISKEIKKFTYELTKNYKKNNHSVVENKNFNDPYFLNEKSKNDFKKTLKEFAVYEVYKVMNPKRIAGEAKKDNYAHNMMMGGKKLASKYEGGRESDLKSYGEKEVLRIQRARKVFHKKSGDLGI